MKGSRRQHARKRRLALASGLNRPEVIERARGMLEYHARLGSLACADAVVHLTRRAQEKTYRAHVTGNRDWEFSAWMDWCMALMQRTWVMPEDVPAMEARLEQRLLPAPT